MPAKQPYEVLIKFDNTNSKLLGRDGSAIKPKAEMRRSKTGCFNCRKIKKKCSETKPCCERCGIKGLQCIWPASKKEKLPANYVIMNQVNTSSTVGAASVPKETSSRSDQARAMTEQFNTLHPLIREETPNMESLVTDDTDSNLKESQYLRILDEFKFQTNISTGSVAGNNPQDPVSAASPMSLSSLINDQSLDFLNIPSNIFVSSSTKFDSSINSNNNSIFQDHANNLKQQNVPKIQSLDSPGKNYQSLEEYESLPPTPINQLTTKPSLNTKSQFMYACLHGFIRAVAPQHTHPSLTTTATFTPIFNQANMNNTILEQVAYACGAAFLSWNKDDITSIAMDLYEAAYSELAVLIDTVNIMRRDELIWVCGASQMLCLCGKIISKTGDYGLLNIRNTYKVIKSRLKMIEEEKRKANSKKETSPRGRRTSGSSSDFESPRPSPGPISSSGGGSFALNMLNMEIENECLGSKITMFKGTDMDDDVALSRNQFERMFIESFIYNYCILLITVVKAEKFAQLPNPFQVFKELRTFLKIPIFKCEVAWMNNPVLGAASDAFELIGKTSYLLRQLDNPLTIPMAEKLLDIASFYPSSIIPLEIKAQSEETYINLKESVLMSDIALKCCKILLMKIINFDKIRVNSNEVQSEVRVIISKFKLMTRGALVKRIATWPLFITGLMCINSDEREFVVRELVDVGYDIHSRHLNQIVHVLRDSWSCTNEGGVTGFDVLWNEEIMESLTL
ncbi:hypothetical protein WICPIJ_009503 [Wickerhamomyces pijperi]|uniref:Zn(2)-C6 fungal-type domain-containing protein n=1 Tax=Wickerhamomyces pijperi TaxID=599730 RepID=A0A9P8PNH8_WICPI|nr:hypothetical protein WICPIJ_009503 [Wickerhamomyces pijperi]